MNQLTTGRFIAQKRKEKNLTQEQLAEKLGVSNKTVSKWETGKCMPDYSIVKHLCQELEISIAELMDGETKESGNTGTFNEQQMIAMLERIQRLEKQKHSLLGIVLITMGIALLAVSLTFSGTAFRDFISGLMLGLSIGEMLIGVFLIGRSFRKQ